jgi:hypothetical protein
LADLNPAQQSERDAALKALFARLDDAFKATIVAINRLTPTIIEVVVKAPMAAEKFHPGQFSGCKIIALRLSKVLYWQPKAWR